MASGVLDAPRYRRALRGASSASDLHRAAWVDLCNRGERLTRQADQRGVRCEWLWTSSLNFPQRNPSLGRELLQRALRDWPLVLADAPSAWTGVPELSFILGHRGEARIPLLDLTLASVAAQRDVSCEVIVVEQSEVPLLPGRLPRWVRYLHTPLPWPDMPFSRSWAFNFGARAATSEALVFLDGDVCPPRDYAREVLSVLDQGFEAARLQRFVFYMSAEATAELVATRTVGPAAQPDLVVQNCQGHTLAVRRSVYFEVGGHDEGFLGWGGEDNEMFDRLRARRLHDHAYLPFLHLYHAPQVEKIAGARSPYFEQRMALPAAARIDQLKKSDFGRSTGPCLR